MRVHPSLSGGRFPAASLPGLQPDLAFSTVEYQERLVRARAAMDAEGLDALVVMNPASVFYLSGYQTFAVDGGACLVVPREAEPALAMDPPEFGGAMLGVWFADLHGYPPETERPAYAARMLAERGAGRGRIGIDDAVWGATMAFHAGLARALPEAEFVSAGELLIDLKRRKSAAEIGYIRLAALATQAAVDTATVAVAAGVTDGEVAGAAFAAMARSGGEYPCLSPIVTSGRHSGVLHSTHKRRMIEPGDNVLLEIGACVQRYTAPQMRTLSIGPPAPEVQRAADACIAALNAVLGSCGPASWQATRQKPAGVNWPPPATTWCFTGTSATASARGSHPTGRTQQGSCSAARTRCWNRAWCFTTPSPCGGWGSLGLPSARPA